MEPESLRADCPAFESCCYLNTGATGPSPRSVVEAVSAFERHHQFEAPCAKGPYIAAREGLEGARKAVASLIGASPQQIALTRSTVEGVTHIAGAIDWDPGDVVVHTDLEHPAGELPWQRLRDVHDIEIRQLTTDNGRLHPETIADTVADARLVCLSSLTWNYGTRLPVSKVVDIAHDAGAKVLVDAVQSVGQQPVDVTDWGADFVTASGHKWLLGPWGTGFLYVAEPESLAPDRIGYFSVVDPNSDAYAFRADARRFELGTTAVAPYAGLETAIETIQAIGLDTIERRIADLRTRLVDGLGGRLVSPPDARSGLVTFEADEPETLVERLSGEGIKIRMIPEPAACRASVHAINTPADIDRLLAAL